MRPVVRAGPLAATLATIAALLLLLLWWQGAGGLGAPRAALGPSGSAPPGAVGPRVWAAHAPVGDLGRSPPAASAPNATGNLTASLGRLVLLVSLAAGAVITLAWSRVAVSWFSHDATKKVQAKERARDALVGSLILVAAVTGLAWGLAQWVLTGV